MDIEARNIMVKYTKNQTLPRVDLFGTIGTMGLAGRGNPDTLNFGGGDRSAARELPHTGMTWQTAWLQEIIITTPSVSRSSFPSATVLPGASTPGPKSSAARAATFLKDLENNVINEVKETLRQVNTDHEKVEAARASLRLAKERLNAEEKKFEVGLTTTRNVLEYQGDLATGRKQVCTFSADYEKSWPILPGLKVCCWKSTISP